MSASVYLFDNGLAPYASYSESFHPQSGTGYGGSVFKPTEGKQYEIGIKYQPPGSNSFITAAIFDLRQSNVPTTDPDPTQLLLRHRSLPESRTVKCNPVVLNWKARPASMTTWISLRRMPYLDNRISKSNNTVRYAPISDIGVGPAINAEGTTTYAVPRHTASAWADYTLHVRQP